MYTLGCRCPVSLCNTTYCEATSFSVTIVLTQHPQLADEPPVGNLANNKTVGSSAPACKPGVATATQERVDRQHPGLPEQNRMYTLHAPLMTLNSARRAAPGERAAHLCGGHWAGEQGAGAGWPGSARGWGLPHVGSTAQPGRKMSDVASGCSESDARHNTNSPEVPAALPSAWERQQP